MNLQILCIKRKKAPGITNTIIATSRHVPRLNRWQVTLLFYFNYSHALPINHRYIQNTVWKKTGPQNMNVGAQCENYGQFSLKAIHMWPRINTSTVVKKENGAQRKTKVSPRCTHCSYCKWRKAPLRPKWHRTLKKWACSGWKNEPVALATVELCWSKGISQSVSY